MIGKVILLLVVPALVYASWSYTEEELRAMDVNEMDCAKHMQKHLLLPDFTDKKCSDVFYMCDHGKEMKFICPEPLVFNYLNQTCDWKGTFECIQRCSSALDGSGDGEPNMEDTPDVDGPSDIFHSVLDCQNPESASNQVPYPFDCQKYWKCVYGTPQIHTCTDGLFFNAQTEQCDFEANAHCEVHPEDELQGEYIVFK